MTIGTNRGVAAIDAVVLISGEVDMIGGLLTQRERQAFGLYATAPVQAVLDVNPVFFQEQGELAAIVELRRHFPLFENNEQARSFVLAIASWKPTSLRLPTRGRKPRAG